MDLKITSRILATAGTLAVAMMVPAARGQTPATGAASAAGGAVLTERSFWRKHYTFIPPRYAATGAAATAPKPQPADSIYEARFGAPPPADWADGDFDDGDWLIRRGREFVCGDGRLMQGLAPNTTNVHLRGGDPFVEQVGMVCQRSRFVVKDRRRVSGLTLALTYRGGFVAYLNGREIARAHLPAGPITAATPAEDYPLDAWLYKAGKEKGKYLHAFYVNSPWHLRERSFGPKAIPADALRDGVNVLAIELHRSNYHPGIRRVKGRYGWQRRWSTVGLSLLDFRADAPPEAIGDGRPQTGPQAWTADITRAISDRASPSLGETLTPVRIVAVGNGSFSGQVIVADAKPLVGLSARASALSRAGGSGTIPAGRVQIRYGAANPLWRGGIRWRDAVIPVGRDVAKAGLGTRIDALLDAAPKDAHAVAVWITVHVPNGLPAGRYTGKVTISVRGAAPFVAPVDLELADWTLPEVKDYGGLINIYQSPETLAAWYRARPWSDAHWKLIERSMRLMGRAGNIGLFLPLLAQSQRGNDDSYVRFVKRPDGTYSYDFTIFDRYLDEALKHHHKDRLWFICLVAWGYEGEPKGRAPVMVTVLDPATGKTSLLKLPRYGTPEAEAVFRPLLHACRDRLKTRGLAGKILIGMAWDYGPNVATTAMFRRILPRAGWLTESHMRVWSYRHDAKDKRAVVPVKYNSVVWGGGIPDPAVKRLYGWRHGRERLTMNFNRVGVDCLWLTGFPTPWSFHMWMESTLSCGLWGRNGNGNVGGDYWKIVSLLDKEGRLPAAGSAKYWNGSGTYYGLYPASNVGRTGVGNNTTDLFAPGPSGAVSTVRFENALEGNQESEAKIVVERALLDKDNPLPEPLAADCRRVLGERINALRLWALGAAEIAPYQWQDRNRDLFAAAGKVAKALKAPPAPPANGK